MKTKREIALYSNEESFAGDIEYICEYLPVKIGSALKRISAFSGERALEVHICRGTGSSVRFFSKKIYLGITVYQQDIDAAISAFTGGALYAYRDTLKEGYITLDRAVRVGICGQARYEGNVLVGVSDVSSMLIRLPCESCAFADRLYDAFLQSRSGMLIFAPASGGKTTALRALIRQLAEKGEGRISVIDERREMDMGDFFGLDVDVFRGYRRAEGMRIALRVMSAQILAVDEIGASCESVEMLESLLSGVKFIATAHGKSYEEIRRRKNLIPFFELGIFDTYVRIFNTDTGFECEILHN